VDAAFFTSRHDEKPSLYSERPASACTTRGFGFRLIVCYEFSDGRTPGKKIHNLPCFLCYLTFIEGLVNIAELDENEEDA
jgi:hypothetical protein